jgi:hypothetical protein
VELIELGNRKVTLDPKNFLFDEYTLNEFFRTFAAKYNEFNSCYGDAQFLCAQMDDLYNKTVDEKFYNFKNNDGGSDKFVEARVNADPEVVALLEKKRIIEHKKNAIYGYLRSLDKCHDDAIQLSYNVRKELDKIFHVGMKTAE